MAFDSGFLLEVKDLKKSFPGVLALKGVSLTLGKGEVISLIGENGAGKSTLMKILAGVQPADSGDYFIDGKKVEFKNVRDAMDLGIALIHQELNLASNLDLASNIFLGREPGKKGFIEYFTRMHNDYKDKSIQFLRSVAERDLVVLHTYQKWPNDEEFVTMDFFRFDSDGKIVEHWDSIQKIPKTFKHDNTML